MVKPLKYTLVFLVISTSVLAQGFYAHNLQELKDILFSSFQHRMGEFTVTTDFLDFGEVQDAINTIISQLKCQDPYTYYNYSGYQINYSGFGRNVTIHFQVFYRTTLDQEAFVDQKVRGILARIVKDEMSDYDKVKSVHDWVVLNIGYDETESHYTAYDALKTGTAVCQGYSLLVQKMLSVLGIGTKIVEGYARAPHSWNMVKLCCGSLCRWFHMDATWDDPVPDVKGRVLYNYFLLSDDEIENDHYIEDSCGLKAPETYEEFAQQCAGTLPELQIKASGIGGYVLAEKETPLSITVSMNSLGVKDTGDYFIWAETPFGTYWLTEDLSWIPSDTPISVATGPPIDFSDFTLLYVPPETLPSGVYTFHFAFDKNPNGRLDSPRAEAYLVVQIE